MQMSASRSDYATTHHALTKEVLGTIYQPTRTVHGAIKVDQEAGDPAAGRIVLWWNHAAVLLVISHTLGTKKVQELFYQIV
jgi:hypothetical protein